MRTRFSLLYVALVFLSLGLLGVGYLHWAGSKAWHTFDDQAPKQTPTPKAISSRTPTTAAREQVPGSHMGCARSSFVDTSGWDTYRNNDFGFEVKYPGAWSVDQVTKDTYVASQSAVNSVLFEDGAVAIHIHHNTDGLPLINWHEQYAKGRPYAIGPSNETEWVERSRQVSGAEKVAIETVTILPGWNGVQTYVAHGSYILEVSSLVPAHLAADDPLCESYNGILRSLTTF